MNKLAKVLMTVLFLTGVVMPVFASDWEVAGKVLTGLEGLRVISGGEIDVIGTITGINRRNCHSRQNFYQYEVNINNGHHQRQWVPDYVWEERWVPAHREYDSYRRCTVLIPGHYVRYKVERGGHWVYYNQRAQPRFHHDR
jgi:hypothetical protein